MAAHGWILSLAILSLMALDPRPSAAAEPLVRPRPLPGGVASPDGRTGFLATADGGVRVVDLQKGAFLEKVSSQKGLRPLIATDRLVVTLGPPDEADRGPEPAFCVTAIDYRDGARPLAKSRPVPLPKWVPPLGRPVQGDWGKQSLRFDARIRGDHLLVLCEASQRHRGGMYNAAAQQGPIQHDERVLSFLMDDLVLEESTPLDRVDGATLAAFDRPPARFANRVESLAYRRDGETTTAPLLVGGTVVTFAEERGGDVHNLTLRRWNPADPVNESTQPLMPVRGGYQQLDITLDGRHLLVSEAVVAAKEAPRAMGSLFALDSGRLLARFPLESGMRALSVLDGVCYYESLERAGGGVSASNARYLKAAGPVGDAGLHPLWRLELVPTAAINAAPPPPPPSGPHAGS